MKKLIALLLAVIMVFAMSACGNKTGSGNASPSDVNTPATAAPAPTQEPAPTYKDAVEVFSLIWAQYGDGDKFPIFGGSFDAPADDGPGAYTLGDDAAVMLDADFGLPTDMADKVDEVACLRHMMNVNTFTGAVFHVKSSGDVKAVADALKSSVLEREWMCGFPDELVVYTVGDYVISVFGNEELIPVFKDKTAAALNGAEPLYDEALMR